MTGHIAISAALLLATGAAAQPAAPARPTISVSGSGSVSTPPDRATLAWTVHGEGATPDEAVKALAGKRKAIEDGIARLAGGEGPRGNQVNVAEVRGRDCNGG